MNWITILTLVISFGVSALVRVYLDYLRRRVVYSDASGEVVLRSPAIVFYLGIVIGIVALAFLYPLFSSEELLWQLVYTAFSAISALGAYRIFCEYFHHRVIFGDDYIQIVSSDEKTYHLGFEEIIDVTEDSFRGIYLLKNFL